MNSTATTVIWTPFLFFFFDMSAMPPRCVVLQFSLLVGCGQTKALEQGHVMFVTIILFFPARR